MKKVWDEGGGLAALPTRADVSYSLSFLLFLNRSRRIELKELDKFPRPT